MNDEAKKFLETYASEHNGRLDPVELENLARRADNPLHPYLEWDDKVAGRKFRVEQIKELIKSVKVERTTTERTITVRQYHDDPTRTADQSRYISAEALKKEDLEREALIGLFKQAGTLLKRARDAAVVFGMADDVTKLEEQFASVQVRIETATYSA
jgi:hypothetical protein